MASEVRTHPLRPASGLGLLVAGAAAVGLLSACTTGSLKDALTTPPPVSSSPGPDNAYADTTGAATAAPDLAAPGATTAKDAQAGAAAQATTAGRRSVTEAKDRSETASRSQPSAPERQKGTATRDAGFVEEGAAKTGTYPKFVPPKAATSQMTDEEKKKFEEMMAERIRTSQQPVETPAEAAEREKLLKALAAKHAEDALKETRGD